MSDTYGLPPSAIDHLTDEDRAWLRKRAAPPVGAPLVTLPPAPPVPEVTQAPPRPTPERKDRARAIVVAPPPPTPKPAPPPPESRPPTPAPAPWTVKPFARMVPGVCGKCRTAIPAGGLMAMSPRGLLCCVPCASGARPERKGKAPKKAAPVAVRQPAPARPAPEARKADALRNAVGDVPPAGETRTLSVKPQPGLVTFRCPTCGADGFTTADGARRCRDSHPLPGPMPSEGKPLDTPAAAPAPEAPAGGCAVTTAPTDLRAAVALCKATSDPRSTIPALNNVLVRCANGRAYLEATDLTTHVTVAVPGNVAGEGACTVPVASICKTTPKGKAAVTLTADGKALELAGTRLATGPAADWPKAPTAAPAAMRKPIPRAVFADMLRRTMDAVATDDSRYHLSGIMLGNRDTAVAVGTDGHRMHLSTRGGFRWPWDGDVIVPRKGALVLIRALESSACNDADVGVTDGRLTVVTDRAAVRIKLVDAQFPPYECVVPKDSDGRVHVDARAFDAALAKAGKMYADGPKRARLETSAGKLVVSAEDADGNSARTELDAITEGRALVIGLNVRYVRDWLATCDAQNVTLEYQGELDPATIRAMGLRGDMGIVMPMRS